MKKRGLSAGLIAVQAGPVLLYVGLIFALSSLPQSRLGSAATWFAIPHADKLMHFTEYACLGALGLRALFLRGHGLCLTHAFPAMLALGSLCGLCDELYQATIPTRDSSAGDFLADFCGIFAGALIARWFLGRPRTFSRADAPTDGATDR